MSSSVSHKAKQVHIAAMASSSNVKGNSFQNTYVPTLHNGEELTFEQVMSDYNRYYDDKAQLVREKFELDMKYSDLYNKIRERQTRESAETQLKNIEESRAGKAKALRKVLDSFKGIYDDHA